MYPSLDLVTVLDLRAFIFSILLSIADLTVESGLNVTSPVVASTATVALR